MNAPRRKREERRKEKLGYEFIPVNMILYYYLLILLLRIINMEVSFDQYVRNIRMFYNQLIKGHPKEEQLAPKFKQMIES